MKKAAVIYRSATGTTRRYGEAIAAFLTERGVEATVASVGECDVESIRDVDFVFLGCWTNGWFVIHQHPDEPWLALARDLPAVTGPRVALFTTYKLLTGTMFAKMREALAGKLPSPALELKSRDGTLSDADRRAIDAFVAR